MTGDGMKLSSIEGKPVQLVEEEEHCARIAAPCTQPSLFGDTLVQMYRYLEGRSATGRGACVDKRAPRLLDCVARDKVRPVRREDEPRRLGQRRVDHEAVTERDRKKQRFESMQRGALFLRQHSEPGIDLGSRFDDQAHCVFLLISAPWALMI
jgi:hypothetical protein